MLRCVSITVCGFTDSMASANFPMIYLFTSIDLFTVFSLGILLPQPPEQSKPIPFVTSLEGRSAFFQPHVIRTLCAMESDPITLAQASTLLQPSIKNSSHVLLQLDTKPDVSSHRVTLVQGLTSRAGTPILRLPTPLSSFAKSFGHLGFSTPKPQTATSGPKSPKSISQPATTNRLEPFPDFEPAVTSARASLNSPRPPSSRAPSATPQRSQKRKRVISRRLYYSLFGVLLLFLLAVPITTLLFIQAVINGSLLVPYLLPLLLVVGFSIATGAGSAKLWSKRRQRRKEKKRKDAIEIEKWKTLAREKSRELEIVGWAAERLRGGLRSLSRGRAASEGGKGSVAEERARSKDGRPRQDSKARSKRSVSRGRTGREKAREEVSQAHEQGVSDTASLQPRGKGSVARARAAALAIKERREIALMGIRETVQSKPASSRSRATTIQKLDTNKPLPPLPRDSPRWAESAAATASNHQRKPSNPLLRQLLRPSESSEGEPVSAGFRATKIDEDVLAEIQKQIVERSRSRAAKDRAKQAEEQAPEDSKAPIEAKKAAGTKTATRRSNTYFPDVDRGLDITNQRISFNEQHGKDVQLLKAKKGKHKKRAPSRIRVISGPDFIRRFNITNRRDSYNAGYSEDAGKARKAKHKKRTSSHSRVISNPDFIRGLEIMKQHDANYDRYRELAQPVNPLKTEKRRIAAQDPEPYQPSSIQPFDLMNQDHAFDEKYDDDDDGTADDDEEIDHSSHPSTTSQDSPIEVMRGGHGGMGSSQSDDNFESSHALDDDAISMSSSVREAKRAESLRKVAMWANRSAITIAGISKEGGAGENVEGETVSGEKHAEHVRGADSRGESTSPVRHTLTSKSIHDLRQRFDEWVGERRQRSRGRTWSITGR
jgi:hypothetical protein